MTCTLSFSLSYILRPLLLKIYSSRLDIQTSFRSSRRQTVRKVTYLCNLLPFFLEYKTRTVFSTKNRNLFSEKIGNWQVGIEGRNGRKFLLILNELLASLGFITQHTVTYCNYIFTGNSLLPFDLATHEYWKLRVRERRNKEK